MVVTTQMLTRAEVIDYVAQKAPQYGVDPAAMLAVANHEGLNTSPGSSWVLPSESGFNFGPPSWYSGGAPGAAIVAQQGKNAAAWSWSSEGLDHWIAQIAQVSAGLTGGAAISAIVTKFENPRADLVQGEISNATHDYASFQQQIQGIIPIPGTLPPQIPVPIPGQPSNPQTPVNVDNPTTTTAAPPFSLSLFKTPLGPINLTLPWDFSGILMVLAAIFVIIIGALLWGPSRSAITTTVKAAA